MYSGLDNKIEDAIGIKVEISHEVEHALPGEIDIMRISEIDEKERHLCIPLIVFPKKRILTLLVVDLRVHSGKTSIRRRSLHQAGPLNHPIRKICE